MHKWVAFILGGILLSMNLYSLFYQKEEYPFTANSMYSSVPPFKAEVFLSTGPDQKIPLSHCVDTGSVWDFYEALDRFVEMKNDEPVFVRPEMFHLFWAQFKNRLKFNTALCPSSFQKGQLLLNLIYWKNDLSRTKNNSFDIGEI